MSPLSSAPPRQRPLPLLFALLFAAPVPGITHAAGPEKPADTQLDPVLVTAERGSDTNTVVRANRIEVEQATSLRDLFKQTPEVNVAGGLPAAQKLYVRGLSERMLTVTIDGAAQPESAYHHTGQVMIEPELLKRVEIEAGTGAATAGPGALAGALRFTTKNTDDLLRPGEQVGALLKGSAMSVHSGHKLSATAFGRINPQLGLIAGISTLDSGDYRDGHGRRVANSRTDTRAAFFKADGKLGGGHRYQLSYEEIQDEGLRNKRTNLLPAPFNPVERQRTERNSLSFGYGYAPGDPRVNLQLVAYANDNSIRLAMDKPAPEHDGTRSRGFNLSNRSQLGDHRLSYGLDYRRDTGYARLASRNLPDETASVAGVYLQDDLALGEQWLLGIGSRYDRYRYTDGDGQRFSSTGFSPSASVAFLPTPELSVRLSHARALRGVGIVEPFLRQYQDNDPALKAEKARNTELGVQWQSGPWRANASVFRQYIDHYIGYDAFRANLGDVTVRGYSASFGYQVRDLSASLGVASARPTMNGQPLSDGDALLLGNATGRTWVAQVDYRIPAWNLQLGWTGRLAEKLTRVPSGSATKPGYSVHDLYARWLPNGKDDFSVTLGVKNLFDRYYLDQGSFGYHPRWGAVAGLPEPGRDVRLTLAWRI